MRRFTALGALAISAAALVLGLATESSAAPATATAQATAVRAAPVHPSVTTFAVANRASSASVRNGGPAFVSGVVALPVSTVSTVLGLSWAGPVERGTRVWVSVREGQRWGAGQALAVEGSTSNGRVVADPLVARAATAVRFRVETPSGRAPRAVRLVSIASPAATADAVAVGASLTSSVPSTSTRTLLSAAAAPTIAAPTVITRAQWGADETRRTGSPAYSQTLRVGFLHHTTGWTTYSQAEAFQFIRALYDWYTTPVAQGGPGYSDMIYNVLVDRFGRVFEGRAGGLDKAVVANQAVGFDRDTFSVAAMGDFESNPLPADTGDAMISSIAQVMAWKLAPFGRDPRGTATLTSTLGGGSSKYRAGQVATIPVIAAHSDVAATTSPGRSLTARLGQIRDLAATLMGLPKPSPAFSLRAGLLARASYLATAGATVAASTTRPMNWVATITSDCLTRTIRVLRGRQAYSGPLDITWNLRDSLGVAVTPGVFRVTLNGTAVDGGQRAAALVTSVRVTAAGGSVPGPCASTPRTRGSSGVLTSVALGHWAEPTAQSAVLVAGTRMSDLAFQLVAAPLAHARHVPMLVIGTTAVPAVVMADLRSRGVVSVIIVGGASVVSPAVDEQLAANGIAVQRIGGPSLAVVAAAVARQIGAPGARGALFVDPIALPAESALASAAAARTGRPVLIISGRAIPAATSAYLAARSVVGGAVVAPPFVLGDALVRSLGAVRVWSTDYSTLALRLAPAGAAGDRVVLVPVRSRMEASVAAATGRALLPMSSDSPSPSVSAWLEQHAEVEEVAAAVPHALVPDAALASLALALATRAPAPFSLASVAIGRRGASVSATPSVPPVPESFVVTGSGWGHGIGLSQAGAYGQAREGRTGEEIVTHYYTDTAVTPVNDMMELAVALLHRVPSASLRTEPTRHGATGAVRVALAGGVTVVGTSADTFGFRFRRGQVLVTRTTAGVKTLVGVTPWVHITWAGTRAAGPLGRRTTLVNVVGPGDSFSDRQHRYRYGTLDVRAIAATSSSPAGLMVLNNVRLHDEYLYGIAEVEASWPLAALQAQIMASRSYAYAQWRSGLRSKCLCHSDDGGGPYYDQTFLGWVKVDEGSYSAAWRAAVDSTLVSPTEGKAITYRGTVITAYYTDSTGGRTRNNEDVWGDAPEPWARSVDDHWSLDPVNSRSFAQWRPRTRTQQSVAAAFGLPDVVTVGVTSRQSSGTALVMQATSSTGATSTISGAAFRRAMELPSLWMWAITPTPAPTA